MASSIHDLALPVEEVEIPSVGNRNKLQKLYAGLFSAAAVSDTESVQQELEDLSANNLKINKFAFRNGRPITFLIESILRQNPQGFRALIDHILANPELRNLLTFASDGDNTLALALATGDVQLVEPLVKALIKLGLRSHLTEATKRTGLTPAQTSLYSLSLMTLCQHGNWTKGDQKTLLGLVKDLTGEFDTSQSEVHMKIDPDSIKCLLDNSVSLTQLWDAFQSLKKQAAKNQNTGFRMGPYVLTFLPKESKDEVLVFDAHFFNARFKAFPNAKLRIVADYSDVRTLLEQRMKAQAENSDAQRMSEAEQKRLAEFESEMALLKQQSQQTTFSDQQRQQLQKMIAAQADARLAEHKNEIDRRQAETKQLIEQIGARQDDQEDRLVKVEETVESLGSLVLVMFDEGNFEPDYKRKQEINRIKQNAATYRFFRSLANGVLTILSKAQHGTAEADKIFAGDVFSKILTTLADHASLPVISGLMKAAGAGSAYWARHKKLKRSAQVSSVIPLELKNFVIDLALGLITQHPQLIQLQNTKTAEQTASIGVVLLFTMLVKIDQNKVDPDDPQFLKQILETFAAGQDKGFLEFRKSLLKIAPISSSVTVAKGEHQVTSTASTSLSSQSASQPIFIPAPGVKTTSTGKPMVYAFAQQQQQEQLQKAQAHQQAAKTAQQLPVPKPGVGQGSAVAVRAAAH